jgi:hypothetical protein
MGKIKNVKSKVPGTSFFQLRRDLYKAKRTEPNELNTIKPVIKKF